MSRIERGGANPSLDAIEVLADALRIETKELCETAAASVTLPSTVPPPIMVPFAADGSCFNPSLRRPKSGKFTVGDKESEVMFDSFESALEYLKAMKSAQWRRPNKAGNWGSVVAVRWDALPIEYLTC